MVTTHNGWEWEDEVKNGVHKYGFVSEQVRALFVYRCQEFYLAEAGTEALCCCRPFWFMVYG